MTKVAISILLSLAASAVGYPKHSRNEITENLPFTFVSRSDWGANEPSLVIPLNTPIPFVVIHHTYIPPICLTQDQCMRFMRSMQNSHQGLGWADIGYNFAIGGEGSVYEGRGWDTLGSHTGGFNSQSIGIVFIGDFVSQIPPAIAIQSAKQLIALGVKLGYISADYKLVGHRQVTATECPGEALFQEIQTWDRFSNERPNRLLKKSTTII